MREQTNAQSVPDDAPRRLLEGDISIELSPDQVRDFSASPAALRRGSRVFLTHLTGKSLDAQVEAAARLLDMGYVPVPHLGARNFASADDYVRHIKAHSRNGVTTALFIGGNPLIASGPLTEAAQLLAHPVVRDSTIRHAFIGGYPEGHPAISHAALDDALKAKVELSTRAGLSVQVVSQFAFDGLRMAAWANKLQSRYPGLPVRIGLAGVTSLPKLIKFAVKCGVGPSLAALKRSGTGLFNVLAEKDPGDIIAGIEAAYPVPAALLDIHFFPFGGWVRTLEWIAAERSR